MKDYKVRYEVIEKDGRDIIYDLFYNEERELK